MHGKLLEFSLGTGSSSVCSDNVIKTILVPVVKYSPVKNGTNPLETDSAHDRLFKVRPINSKLQDTFAENYYPGQNAAVDESMVRFKGRCNIKRYMRL